jgi:hypothetical protein
MTPSSRYTRAISSELGDIERRLQALQSGIERLGTRAPSSARSAADGLSDAVATALSNLADRFRQGTKSLGEQSAAFGKDAARSGTAALSQISKELNSVRSSPSRWRWASASLLGWQLAVARSSTLLFDPA